jgi:cytochrome c biogenesis protein CcmG/thiol:disulfide interchange protein DsbE
VPASPRLPLRYIAASTVIALACAIGVVVVLDGGDDGNEPLSPEDIGGLEITPEDGGDPSTAVFTTFDGDAVALATLQGTPTVVNFFASTCAPCITEMPDLEAVHQDVREQVEFLGLAVADRPEAAQRLVEQTGVTYATAQDKDGSVLADLGGAMLPTTVLLDAQGNIVETHTGTISADELRALLVEHFGVTT